MSVAHLFMIIQNWKQPKCPLIEWLSKFWFLHIVDYNTSIKKKNKLSIHVTIQMNLKNIIYVNFKNRQKWWKSKWWQMWGD